MSKKNVWISKENHEFLREISFINSSSIEIELNEIIDKIRKSKEVKIYVTRNE